MNWDAISARVTESLGSIIAFSLLGLAALWIGYRIFKVFTDGYGGFVRAVIQVARSVASEVVGGKEVKPHERINGFLVLALFLLSLSFLAFFAVQSIRATIAGGEFPLGALAGFLACFFVTAVVGLLCVRTCAHHRQDERRVGQLRSRR